MSNCYNKKDLKNISRRFRVISSRVLTSGFEDFDNNLKRFVAFIESEDIIKEFIISCTDSDKDYNIEQEVKEVSKRYNGTIFDSYLLEEDEVSFTFQLLKYITENDITFRMYTMGYTHSNKYQDMVKGFSDRVILPFVNLVNGYLERIFTEMGFDEDVKCNITINGGQLNISKDNSILNATQYNNEIDTVIRELKKILEENNVEEKIKEEILDNAEGIKEELGRNTPRKSILNSLKEGLKQSVEKVPSVIGLGANLAQIISFIEPLL